MAAARGRVRARGALSTVEPVGRAAAARLAALPAVLIHGEAYPSNLLVETTADSCPTATSTPDAPGGPRIRPVDWETLGTGPAALDLAALTSGEWEPEERSSVVAAYREAAGGGPSDDELEAARLMVALQWIGWSTSWTPPAEQRHDWLGAAVSAAEALAR